MDNNKFETFAQVSEYAKQLSRELGKSVKIERRNNEWFVNEPRLEHSEKQIISKIEALEESSKFNLEKNIDDSKIQSSLQESMWESSSFNPRNKIDLPNPNGVDVYEKSLRANAVRNSGGGAKPTHSREM
jgi:LPS O-antigen subunit length determinant protein (WzzB/FepE family)